MGSRGERVRSTMSDTFWILVLSVIVLFAFFVALGAFAPGEVAWLTLGVLAPFAAFDPSLEGALALFLAGFVASLCAGVFLTNTFHQWAHQAEPPRAARWLQALRVAISPQRHARHHASGDAAYCVTTGFCNPALDRWRVFERIERATAHLRSAPHRKRSHG